MLVTNSWSALQLKSPTAPWPEVNTCICAEHLSLFPPHSPNLITPMLETSTEKYLKITQAAKLSYSVFIFKSCAYGAFIVFLVWKFQVCLECFRLGELIQVWTSWWRRFCFSIICVAGMDGKVDPLRDANGLKSHFSSQSKHAIFFLHLKLSKSAI